MVEIKQPGSQTEYVFGTSDAEITRLLERAVLRRPPAERLFDRIGVAPGWNVLDAGCGPLGLLDVLAERVSDSGTVVGVDREPMMIEAARHVLDSRGLQRVRVVTADIAQIPLASESFDLVHERLALLNLAEAPTVVAEMTRLARPGSWVALQEYDHVSLLCQPPHQAWDLLMAAWDRVRTAAAMDNTVGRHLHGLLHAAGVVDIELDVHCSAHQPGAAGQALPLYMADTHRNRMTSVGELTEAQLDAAVAELHAHLAEPGTTVVSPMLFQAWGRKPH